jgi:DNA-directed RNA polymerase subunit RPC12/RpoP
MQFKACSRCQGDLYREEDLGTTELVCLQCGFRRPVLEASTFPYQRMARRTSSRSSRPVKVAA